MTSRAPRQVSCHLALDVHDPVRIDLQIAVSEPGRAAAEELTVRSAGQLLTPTETVLAVGGRVHSFTAAPGPLEITYQALGVASATPARVTDADRILYRRPSRYAESDRLAPVAQAEFAGITDASALLAAVSSWVGSRLSYVAGSSGPTDGAVDTMLARSGVCRDYAHLVIALLRGLDVPARLAAVYAPGLDPMDFHAVVEAAVGDQWRVVDATLLAPRSSLVRIATGRDAADTAFLSSYGGQADLIESTTTATVDGRLPDDDVLALVSLT